MKPLAYLPLCILLCMAAACSKHHSSGASVSYGGTASLSEPRSSFASASAGNKAFFAGGINIQNNEICSSTVDIYDAGTGAWTTAKLSEPRYGLSGAAAGGKVLFAGGSGNILNIATVDIYDAATGSWTTAQLSKARENIAAAAVGNKIVFGGGNTMATLIGGYDVDTGVTDTVDVYDAKANSWTLSKLSVAREGAVGAMAGNELLIAGGAIPTNPGVTSVLYQSSATVDFYLVNGQ